MEGVVLEDVFVIPRTSLRGINRVYLIDPAGPAIRKTTIDPVWTTSEVLVVREGLASGDWLATSRLPYTPDGAPVEIISPPVAADGGNPATGDS